MISFVVLLLLSGMSPARSSACSLSVADGTTMGSRAVLVSDPKSPAREVRIAGILWSEDPNAACVARRFMIDLVGREGANPVVRGRRRAARLELTVSWVLVDLHADQLVVDPATRNTRVDLAQVLLATGAAVVDPGFSRRSTTMSCSLEMAALLGRHGRRGVWASPLEIGSCSGPERNWSVFWGIEDSRAIDSSIRDELSCIPVACEGIRPEACLADEAERMLWLRDLEEAMP